MKDHIDGRLANARRAACVQLALVSAYDANVLFRSEPLPHRLWPKACSQPSLFIKVVLPF